MYKLLVIADDFTGALDTGVRFADAGVKTLVALNIDSIEESNIQTQVLVINSETRHLSGIAAYDTVRDICLAAKRLGIPYLYKKTDSTLRGNIGSEMQAMLDVYPEESIYFIPAYPKMGRTTMNGLQYVNGTPLNETAVGKDPLNPIKTAVIKDILNMGISKTVHIFDCDSDERMDSIARVFAESKTPKITAGCAGFAHFLPMLINFDKFPINEVKKIPSCRLIISGSVHERSILQVTEAEKIGIKNIVLEEDFLMTQESGRMEAILNEIGKRDITLLKTVNKREDCLSDPQMISKGIGNIAKELINGLSLETLTVFGGDTAMAVMKALGVIFFEPVKELIEGVPFTKITYRNKPFFIITKAGGFGDDDVVDKILNKLKEME